MSLNEKLHAKLKPHADRLEKGEDNDFDYLPAVLLHAILLQQETHRSLEGMSTTFLESSNQTRTQIEELAKAQRETNQFLSEANEKLISRQQETQEKIREHATFLLDNLVAHQKAMSDHASQTMASLSQDLKKRITDLSSAQAQTDTQLKILLDHLGKHKEDSQNQHQKNRYFLMACLLISALSTGVSIALLLR